MIGMASRLWSNFGGPMQKIYKDFKREPKFFLSLWPILAPPRSVTLSWWWGLAPMTRKISKIWRRGATKRWPNSCRQIATCYQCSCAGFGFTADYGFIAVYLRLYSHLFTASQPSTAL